MARLLIALGLVVVVGVVALVLRRRQRVDVPTQQTFEAPAQLDRADFDGADREWLVVVFSSTTCHTCADVVRKAAVVASTSVAVAEVPYVGNEALHRRYKIDGVPTLVLADGRGVVRASFLGPVTATDLWAAIAEARDPGSSPEPGLGHHDHDHAHDHD